MSDRQLSGTTASDGIAERNAGPGQIIARLSLNRRETKGARVALARLQETGRAVASNTQSVMPPWSSCSQNSGLRSGLMPRSTANRVRG